MTGVNWIGVIVACIVTWLIGWVWYDMLFGAAWMAAMKLTEAQIAAMGYTPMIFGFLNGLIACVGLGLLVPRFGGDLMGGVKAGLLAGIFFACTTEAMGFIYGGKDQALIPIDFGYLLVLYVVAGAIIGGLKFGGKAGA